MPYLTDDEIEELQNTVERLEGRLATLESRFRHVCEYNGFWDGS